MPPTSSRHYIFEGFERVRGGKGLERAREKGTKFKKGCGEERKRRKRGKEKTSKSSQPSASTMPSTIK